MFRDNFERREIWFPCGGARCHGILYVPRENNIRAGLVMAMGFGLVKEAHADDFAPYFAERGITVLAFDYRRFGKSEGEPRQALYPMDQVEDYRCAIRYLQDSGLIEKDKVCLWGTSFSGGHVLTLLAFPQPGVNCGIAQVPNVYSYKTALEYFGSLEPVMDLAEMGREKYCQGSPGYIPIVSKEGPAIILTDEAYEYYTRIASRYESFENRVTIDSIDRILAYNPGDYAHLISKPLLIIIALKDKTTPPSLAREIASRIRGDVEIKEYDIGHFDIYRSPHLEVIAEYEAEWAYRRLVGDG